MVNISEKININANMTKLIFEKFCLRKTKLANNSGVMDMIAYQENVSPSKLSKIYIVSKYNNFAAK